MSKYSSLQVKITIRNIAVIFFLFGIYFLSLLMNTEEKVFIVILIINIMFYLAVGIGLLLKYEWAFELFRFFHTLGYYSYPIGTYWAIRMQEKLDADGLSHYFNCNVKELKKRKAPKVHFSRK